MRAWFIILGYRVTLFQPPTLTCFVLTNCTTISCVATGGHGRSKKCYPAMSHAKVRLGAVVRSWLPRRSCDNSLTTCLNFQEIPLAPTRGRVVGEIRCDLSQLLDLTGKAMGRAGRCRKLAAKKELRRGDCGLSQISRDPGDAHASFRPTSYRWASTMSGTRPFPRWPRISVVAQPRCQRVASTAGTDLALNGSDNGKCRPSGGWR